MQSPDETTVTTLTGLDLPFCQVQPLPDGQLLAVAARGGAAAVFDADGAPVRRARVSDGIQHVLTTPSGRVWIGYFDEGVYGDDPVGHHGIVRYTADLTPEWMCPFDTEFGPVDDCYALNADGEAAWSCYYSDFPVVHLAADTVTGWRTTVAGASALLATAGICALIGGYGERRDLVSTGWLTAGRHEPAAPEARLVLPEDRPLPARVHIVGRGPDLHVFTDSTWFRLALDDLL